MIVVKRRTRPKTKIRIKIKTKEKTKIKTVPELAAVPTRDPVWVSTSVFKKETDPVPFTEGDSFSPPVSDSQSAAVPVSNPGGTIVTITDKGGSAVPALGSAFVTDPAQVTDAGVPPAQVTGSGLNYRPREDIISFRSVVSRSFGGDFAMNLPFTLQCASCHPRWVSLRVRKAAHELHQQISSCD